MTNIASFILAGGASSRMGSNKAFLTCKGKTFLERIAEQLENAFAERPAIVVSEKNHHEFAEWVIYFKLLKDSIPELGPISGIHAALQDCEKEFAAIAAIDMPMIEPAIMRFLMEILSKSDKDAVCIRIDGSIQPLPSIFRTEKCLDELEKGLRSEEIFSPLFLIRNLDTLVVDSSEIPFGREVFENVNLPEDLERVRLHLSARN